MARVLILANHDLGLYKFRKEVIEELLKEHHVVISLPNGKFVPELIDLGCKFIDTEISRRGTNPITDFKLLLNYKRILEQVNPDIVLSYTIKPNVYGGLMCRLKKIPYIPNITGLGTAIENGGILQTVTLLLYKMALKDASCVFFQNEENANFMNEKSIVKGKQKVIPGSGVNLDYYELLEYPEDEEVNFLFISRVMKQKGINQYLEAAEYITKKYPKTKFHICGFCEEEYQEILENYQDKGIIKYHGMINDTREILKITHCTIHPTYYPEGLSNVLLESAASGRPIISTNRSGTRETIDEGVNGFLVEERNSKDLIEVIEKFMNLSFEEKQKMGMYGREKVEKEFDRQIVVDQYIGELNNISEGKINGL